MKTFLFLLAVAVAGCGGRSTCYELRECVTVPQDGPIDAPAEANAGDAGAEADVSTDVAIEATADAADVVAEALVDVSTEPDVVEASADVEAAADQMAIDAPPDRAPDVEAGPSLSCGGLNVGPKPTSFRSMDSPPLPMGGTITDGRYVLTNVVFYEDQFSYARATLDIRGGWFHRHYSVYSLSDDPLSGYEEIGTYVTTGGGLLLDVWMCGATMKFPYLWRFTATPTTIRIYTDGPQNSIETIQTYDLVDGG